MFCFDKRFTFFDMQKKHRQTQTQSVYFVTSLSISSFWLWEGNASNDCLDYGFFYAAHNFFFLNVFNKDFHCVKCHLNIVRLVSVLSSLEKNTYIRACNPNTKKDKQIDKGQKKIDQIRSDQILLLFHHYTYTQYSPKRLIRLIDAFYNQMSSI
jgi:hypothetical protein